MSRRLLIIASGFGHIVNFHLPYIKGFHDLGWKTDVACGGNIIDLPYADRLISLPFEKKMFSADNMKAAHIIHRLVKENNYDLIICHTSLAAFFSRLALFGLNKRPKTINVVHGYLFDDNTPRVKSFLLRNAEFLMSGKTDLVLTMNKYDYNWAKAHRTGKRVSCIPGMGVSLNKTDSVAKGFNLSIKPDDFLLVYPAEFSDRKNQSMLIRAMTGLPDRVKLVLPGKGALLEECKEVSKGLGLEERVIFPGYVKNIPALLEMADAAVSASRIEGLPFNLLEAMLASLPVVASNVKGNSDLVENGVTGFLYEYNNGDEYISRIEALMNSEELCRSMGSRGFSKAGEYGLDAVYPKVMKEYLSEVKHD